MRPIFCKNVDSRSSVLQIKSYASHQYLYNNFARIFANIAVLTRSSVHLSNKPIFLYTSLLICLRYIFRYILLFVTVICTDNLSDIDDKRIRKQSVWISKSYTIYRRHRKDLLRKVKSVQSDRVDILNSPLPYDIESDL